MNRVLASELGSAGRSASTSSYRERPGHRSGKPSQRRTKNSPALEAVLSRAIPFGRLLDADDIARAVLYLASDDAVSVTATEIVVDGGQNRGSRWGADL